MANPPPRQLRPARVLFESGGHTPPAQSTSGIAPNLGGSLLTNPSGLQLNTFFIGTDIVTQTYSISIAAGSVVQSGTLATDFTNLPSAQPQATPATLAKTAAVGLLSVPTGAILTMIPSAVFTGVVPSGLVVTPWVTPFAIDTTNVRYAFSNQLPGGVIYKRFGCTFGYMGFAHLVQGGTALTLSVGLTLAIAFPGKSWGST